MSLASATRLGPYEIVAPLGAGGMGEVYRARDTRLGREVALKVLPPAMALDPARRARFEQEARAAAALSHPNIVGLHDVGEAEGVFYIVSELVPGETLGAIVERGPVPAKKLLDIAVQIADGMAAAHAAHITHRDLKPANIMVTPDGRAKILDFGLAKQAAITATSPEDTPTVVQQTEPGMIMGTVAYMSPEQARGKPADHRSDQFSFGLILYEMAAGRKAFDKPEAVQVMAAILSEEPAPIERNIPAPLRWAIDRCLAKDPADRYESTRDLYQDLRHIRDHMTGTTTSQPTAARPAAPGRRIPWQWPVIAVLGLAAVVGASLYLAGPKLPDQSRYRFTPFAFDPMGQAMPIWSPDGKAVVYAGYVVAPQPNQIFVRYLDSPAPIQITSGPDSVAPIAWAPDSKRVVFRSSHPPAGLWSVSVVGGEPESFMPTEGIGSLAVSPDLRSVAVMRAGDDGVNAVWISSPPGAAPRKYLPNPMATRALYNATNLRFSPNGKSILLFMRGDRGRTEAWLMPYPPNSSQPPRLVQTDLTPYGGTPQFSWMPDSRHVVLSFASSPASSSQLWMADTASRKRMALTSGTANHGYVDVSPDGHRIVFTESADDYDLASVDIQHATASRLIATQRDEYMAAWAAKQPVLVYVTDRNGPQEIWLHTTGPDRPVVTPRDFPPGTTQWFLAPALSPDGGRLIYERFENQGGSHLWISAASGGAPVPLTNDSTATEFTGSWSPDGNWFVYAAIRNGVCDLLKVKSTGQASPVLVRHNVPNSDVPAWSPGGDWILFGDDLYSPDGQKSRSLGKHGTPNYAFSTDGKLLYGIRRDGDRNLLFSLDVASGAEKALGDLGQEFAPASSFHPGIRFSMAPDGKSFVYSVVTRHSNLWMFEGFQ
jgi:serine/threonine protein kinase/Tol biopolymer transport system component